MSGKISINLEYGVHIATVEAGGCCLEPVTSIGMAKPRRIRERTRIEAVQSNCWIYLQVYLGYVAVDMDDMLISMQSKLEQTRSPNATLSQDKDTLKEMNEWRSR